MYWERHWTCTKDVRSAACPEPRKPWSFSAWWSRQGDPGSDSVYKLILDVCFYLYRMIDITLLWTTKLFIFCSCPAWPVSPISNCNILAEWWKTNSIICTCYLTQICCQQPHNGFLHKASKHQKWLGTFKRKLFDTFPSCSTHTGVFIYFWLIRTSFQVCGCLQTVLDWRLPPCPFFF